ncbi:MAG: hypothetical protein AAGD11_16295 [Planctomycetota bacterium]
MLFRIAVFITSLATLPTLVYAQASGWRPSGGAAAPPNRYGAPTATAQQLSVAQASSPVTPQTAQPQASAPVTSTGQKITRAPVSKGSGQLPNDHGQVWREYDISSYSLRDQSSENPEQRIVDWILRETGYEAWHSTPVGLLSADSRTLRVYHTPQMQSVVADIVDRFVNRAAETHGFGLRIITIKNPNWRARALPLMTALPVQSPGVQGWMLAKEDAALLMSELQRRTDYREHNPPHQMVQNGQSLVVSTMRPRPYTKGIIRTQQTWPGYQPELGQLDEGFSLEFSPLLAMDTRTTDAVIKLRLAQVEKMLPVKLDVPNNIAPNQRAECQVPQMTMVQLHERFRWPTDQVLLLSMGVVATPGPQKSNVIADAFQFGSGAPRADALLFVESKGPVAPSLPGGGPPISTATRPNQTFHGRY